MGYRVKTVILAGGRGTRIMEESVPKPLVEIRDKPIIHHIMDIYARHGHTEFIVAAGYRHWLLSSYFAFASHGYDVTVVDTGLDSSTAERIAQVLPDSTFFLTYGDGVADIDINALANFHQGQNKTATVTAVTPSRPSASSSDVDATGTSKSAARRAVFSGSRPTIATTSKPAARSARTCVKHPKPVPTTTTPGDTGLTTRPRSTRPRPERTAGWCRASVARRPRPRTWPEPDRRPCPRPR